MSQIPENTKQVVSAARKLIFRVQAGSIVSFPQNAKISGYGVNNEEPQIVVFNGTDPSWQGVDEDNFVIINEVPENVAENAIIIYANNGMPSNESLLKALYYLQTEECVDQYTTNQSFVSDKLSPAGMMLENASGIVKRDDRDMVPTWQENGVYYVAPNNEPRIIEADILQRTYRNVDGSPIDLASVPSA